MANIMLILLGMLFLGQAYSALRGGPIIDTPSGPIRGKMTKTILGKTVMNFLGIPYAKPPINELRFQPPVPIRGWGNVYNTTEYPPPCPQPETEGTSEDCLFLNVFTTELDAYRPVFVFIHPGGYYSGGTSWVRPDYLLDQGIVLVSIQYRLGSLGFISTGDHLAPGNNGLKDQVAALRWVKNNIRAFGGDPYMVTIAGYSAGGSSVSLHLVSPMSRGLFHRAVIMSGSSFGNWPVPEHQFDIAQKQARFVGCPDDTSANIMKCLRTKSAQELGDSLYSFDEFGYEPVMIWYPVIERDFGQERFLVENPVVSVQCGKFEQVPVITTVTTDEFAAKALYILENSTLVQQLNEGFEKVVPIVLLYERDTENSKNISQELKKFYFGDTPISNNTLGGMEKMIADGIIGFPIHRTANLLSSKSARNVFYYRLDYRGRYSYTYLEGTQTPYGVVHHDDLIYIFANPRFPIAKKTKDYEVVYKLTTLLANFAKTGNPTPTKDIDLDDVFWEPYTVQNEKYLDITEVLKMEQGLFKKRYEVWDKLFPIPKCPSK